MVRTKDISLLEAALVGYEAQLAKITVAIADLQKRLGKRGNGHAPGAFLKAPTVHPKHLISAAGRARIAEAQRKRWAAVKKEKAK
jgi:hypothetical protein